MKKKRSNRNSIPLVVVGSVALDTVTTPFEKRQNVLGGSVSYACMAASLFVPVGMVGVVGQDFPAACLEMYSKAGIDIQGLKQERGRTFRWSGEYELNMNSRRTLSTELNVFADFQPELPAIYRASPFLFLANISPGLQLNVLSQVRRPRFVAADTMDLWIRTDRQKLAGLIKKVNLLMVNDSEARMLSGQHSLIKAARDILKMGPEYVVVKKGEHGAALFTRSTMFAVPAFPVEDVRDPTGAGDTFAGGFMGALARGGSVDFNSVRKAMVFGSVLASFGVQDFSVDGLVGLGKDDVDRRLAQFRKMILLPS